MHPEYRQGHAQGVAEARAEVAKNSLTIYTYGEPPYPVPKDLKDVGTGLPLRWIAACVVSPFDIGRRDGHNTIVREHLNAERDAP